MRKLVNLLKVSQKLKELNIFHKVKNQLIITKRSKTKVPKVNNDIAYLLGVITGDGTMIKSKRNRGGFHYIVKITSDSNFYLEYLNKLFEKYFTIKGRIVKDKRKQNTFDLIFQNAVIFWYFNLLGLQIGKKRDLTIPKVINNDELKLNYIAGLTDTDGHVKGNRIQLKQKDKNFLEILYRELNKLGMNCAIPKVNYTDFKPYYYIRFDNNLQLRMPQ